jgi:RimJ/RimL family protein N-acetyltransferase
MYMGHLVFDREGLTSKEKLELTRDAIKRMFKAGARKIIWHLYADNRAFNIFLTKLGAEHEGTLRQGTRRNGELVDVVMMASFPEGTS